MNDLKLIALKIIKGLLVREERYFDKKLIATSLENKDFLNSVLVISTEVILFIENSVDLCYMKLSEALGLPLTELIKILNPFSKFDLTVICLIIFSFLHQSEIISMKLNFI